MKNPELVSLQRELIALHKSLSRTVAGTASQQEAESLLREMEEVNFRVMMCGRLLFKQSTAAINQRLVTVRDATREAHDAMKKIQKAKEIVRQVGQVLVIVDKALDVLKLL